ncbi:rod shape-determining protein MreC [Marivirga salinae]|uniref:Cell shape-determining protein MreC n=1 Tax=Marivirga salinarum TaxID=3059078 RepID=A0AA49J9J2_9BACT|nr:rod shape-determining protein MreC [Marivirga sp. BDSF4-3]WKK76820.2 rod shape-determining protein MreC [Marivirga sp. BDSF4-3]
MRRLFQFIYQYRAFFIFLLLEVISGWLVVNHNDYISASYFNSSSAFAGNVYENKQAVQDYFQLAKVNKNLVEENERLRNRLAVDSVKVDLDSANIPFKLSGQYEFITGKVVNNSVHRFRNYFTLNKGSEDGIEEGMGVINTKGVVGKIKSVSSNFSTAYSALHSSLLISVLIDETETLCTANWSGEDPTEISLEYVPRHIKVKEGMQVVSSGYDAIFPQGVKLGTVKSVEIDEEATFYDIEVALSADFFSLDYVYVIGNKLKQEKDSLEQELQTEYEQ